MTITLPPSLSFSSSSLPAVPVGPGIYKVSLGNLTAQQIISFNFVATTSSIAAVVTSFDGAADEVDPRPLNNSVDVETIVREPEVDLALTLATVPCPVPLAGTFDLAFTISNSALAETAAVAPVFELTFDTSWVVTAVSLPYTLVGTTLTVVLADIAPGGSVPLSVTIQPTDAVLTIGAALVTPAEDDKNTANNALPLIQVQVVDLAAPLVGEVVWASSGPKAAVPGLPGASFTTALPGRPRHSLDGSRWLQTLDTDLATTEDLVVVRGSGSSFDVVAREGVTVVLNNTGNTLLTVDDIYSVLDDGRFAMSVRDAGATTNDRCIVLGSAATPATLTAVLREQDPVPGITGYLFQGSTASAQNFSGASMQLGGTTSLQAIIRLGVTGTTNFALFAENGQTLLARTGVTIPGNQAPETAGSPAALFTNSRARMDVFGIHWVSTGNVSGNADFNDMLFYSGDTVIQEGISFPPFVTPTKGGQPTVLHDLTPTGVWYAAAGNAMSIEWVTRQGQIIAQGGAPIAAMSMEQWSSATSGVFQAVACNDHGDFVIAGLSNAPSTLQDQVMVYNAQTVIAREGDPVNLDGDPLTNDDRYIRAFQLDRISLSNTGELLVVVQLRSGARQFCGLADQTDDLAMLRFQLTPTPPVSRDLAVNGQVDAVDLASALSLLGSGASPADLNRNNVTDRADVAWLLLDMGKTLP